jgi:hypothetical protein
MWFVLPCRASCTARARATRSATTALGSPGADARREFGHRQRGHVDLDVDAIEQRPGQLAQIARRDVRCAAAASGRIAVPAARAGVHRGDQLTGGGKIGLLRSARDRDAAAFERLAQHFQHVPVEFGQLVEKQHAQMGQRDLARLRRIAAADQRGGARRVVRRAERPPPPVRGREAEAARRQQRGGGQRLVVGQWGQQAGQPRCQHRLAGAGRTDHQHVVAARGGHFERASRRWPTTSARSGAAGAGVPSTHGAATGTSRASGAPARCAQSVGRSGAP